VAGIIRPLVNPAERPKWAEAIYLISRKSHQSYTLETPSDYPLSFRVLAHVAAVRASFRVISELWLKGEQTARETASGN
jgi:hypothetical protein